MIYIMIHGQKQYCPVTVVDIYQFKSRLSIVMQEVADCDLNEYLQSTDDLEDMEPKKTENRIPMSSWTGCLIQALDYLHEMKVKHKDIKPGNILIMDGKVLLADFGISKDLIDSDTTASLTANGDIGTRMYCAPEVLSQNQLRGRAADVFSLGCVFLEISTVIVEGKGSLGRWSSLRELSRSRLYANCGSKILQRIDNLRWECFLVFPPHLKSVGQEPYKDLTRHGAAVAELAFFMLDPNPKSRITAQQLVAMLEDDKNFFGKSIKMISCSSCRKFPVAPNPNLPLHSVFKKHNSVGFLTESLKSDATMNWDQAKELWLESHMWW
jgi:serine/threonine protein kinase